MSKRIQRIFLSFLCVLGCSVADNLQAQFRGTTAADQIPVPPRSLQRLLSEGNSAINEERYADAVELLTAIFDERGTTVAADVRGQDFFLLPNRISTEAGNNQDTFRLTLKDAALNLLNSLPPRGREIIEISSGVEARQELNEAFETNNASAIAQVARVFPFTEAGQDAQLWLAQSFLDEGSPIGAAGVYLELLKSAAARNRFGTNLLSATISSLVAGEKKATAETLLKEIGPQYLGQTIQLGNREVELGEKTDWENVLGSLADQMRSGVFPKRVSNWMNAGGSAGRNASISLSMPVSSPRWAKITHGSVPEKNAIRELASAEEDSGRVILPKAEVRTVGNLVLAKTTDSRIIAIDLRTGLTKWACYPDGAPVDFLTPRFNVGGNTSSSTLSNDVKWRVWGSSSFGRFSCDEDSVYYITQPPVNSTIRRSGFQTSSINVVPNQLHAASIEREGSLTWTVGTPADGDLVPLTHNDLVGASFLGPPLSYQGYLYCIVAKRGETQLAVLDAKTGALKWTQQLCQQTFSTQLRTSMALSPAISDGIIVCPTGSDLLVALDLHTRRLRWAFGYQTVQNRRPRFGGAFLQSSGVDALGSRWDHTGLVVQDGRVTLTPVEQDDLHVRDLLTGAEQLRMLRDNGRYLVGADGSKLFVVAEASVRCIDVDEGKIVWNTDFPPQNQLAGQAIWTGESIVVPFKPNRLIRYSAEDGTQLEEATVDEEVGNLFCHFGNLISATPTAVSVYHTRDVLRDSILAKLSSDDGNLEALNLQAQLAFASGEIDSAFESLRKSLAIDSENIETRSLTSEIVLSGLEVDFDRFLPFANEFREILLDNPKRSEFLKFVALGQVRSGNNAAAFASLIEFMRDRIRQSERFSSASKSTIKLSASHRVQVDIWIASELVRCFDAANEELQLEMTNQITEELSKSGALLLSQRMLRLRYFLWHPAAESQVIGLALGYNKRDRQLNMERVLIPLLSSADEANRTVTYKLLSTPTVADRNQFTDLGSIASGVMESPDGNSLEVQTEAPKTNSGLGPGEWHQGVLTFREQSQRTVFPIGTPIDMASERFGRPELSVRLAGNDLILFNANGGIVNQMQYPRATADNNQRLRRARMVGGLLLLETSSEIAAFDIYRGLQNSREAMLWRQSLLRFNRQPNATMQMPRTEDEDTALGLSIPTRRTLSGRQKVDTSVGPLTPAGLILNFGTQLVCVDPYSGKQNWVRDGFLSITRMVNDEFDLAIVDETLGIIHLDCRDGKEFTARREKYTENWKPLFCSGRWAVDYTEVESEIVSDDATTTQYRPLLKVWSPLTGKVLAEIDNMERNSRAGVCEGRFLVVADQNQLVHYFDLQQGLYRKWEMPVDEDLEAIFVDRFDDRLLVTSRKSATAEELTFVSKRNRKAISENHGVNGSVFAIQIENSSLEWEQPSQLYNLLFPYRQPRNSPFAVCYRFNPRLQDSDNNLTENSNVAVLDLRNGKLAHAALNQPVDSNSTMFAMELRPRNQSFELLLGGRAFVYRVTNEPHPPRPIPIFGKIPDFKESGEDLIERLFK
ncbi:MAG: PQQ-binding-like beta-propeller repeat protein [Pirellulaceae bacterium]